MKTLTPLFLFLLALAAPARSQTIDWKLGDTSFHAQPSPLYSVDPANIFHGTPTLVSACLPDPDKTVIRAAVTMYYRDDPDSPERYETAIIGLSFRSGGISCFATISRVPSALSITRVMVSPAPVVLTGGTK